MLNRYFQAEDLLSPPSERPAFSDRQAYLCAELSRLAYFSFEGGFALQEIEISIDELLDDSDQAEALKDKARSILGRGSDDKRTSHEIFGEILEAAGLSLVSTFSRQGTQAYICKKELLDSDESGTRKVIAYVVFRGTELTDFRDIAADVRANLTSRDVDGDSLKVHSGFLFALERVESDLVATLDSIDYQQVFVAGHSLGGALAILFTRFNIPSDNGACYTFGAPPVGVAQVQEKLKTPIYQVNNHVDIVPRLPNPYLAGFMQLLLRGVLAIGRSITVVNTIFLSGEWDEKFLRFIDMLTKYRQIGYMSYLIGSGEQVWLRYNVTFWDRCKWYLKLVFTRFLKVSTVISDHKMEAYVRRLEIHARNRQT